MSPLVDEPSSNAATLHSLAGGVAPPGLGDDLQRIPELPAEARENLWEVLAPSLAEPIAPEAERRFETFCNAFQAPRNDLSRVLKACRFLIRNAAALDVDSERFAQDLDAVGAGAETRELLLAGYDRARVQIRTEMLRATLTDHGNLLVGVDWRIDSIDVSNRGSRLQQPVAMLTLRYRRGAEERRVTLQVLPDVLRELQQACETMLS